LMTIDNIHPVLLQSKMKLIASMHRLLIQFIFFPMDCFLNINTVD